MIASPEKLVAYFDTLKHINIIVVRNILVLDLLNAVITEKSIRDQPDQDNSNEVQTPWTYNCSSTDLFG